MKRTVIWNLKGGQGKTVLSLAVAMLEGAFVVTNDVHSPVDEVLGSDRALALKMTESLPTVPSDVPLIYDFGGYPDARIIDAAKDAEFVVIPIVYESPLEMQVTINAISEIEKYNNNTIVVVNKAQSGDLERAKAVFDSMDITYPILYAENSGMKILKASGNPQGLLPYSLLLDKQGQVIDQVLGKIDEAQIRTWLDEHL